MYGNRRIARICKKYDPSVIGYEWDEENPKIQLEPIGERGYIELHVENWGYTTGQAYTLEKEDI